MKTNPRLIYLVAVLTLISADCCRNCPPEDSCPDPSNPECPEYYNSIVKVDNIFAESLKDNLLGDSPEREVLIYLPPDYKKDTLRKYPVIYMLHGYLMDHNMWISSVENMVNLDIKKYLDSLILNGAISPVIVAAPNAQNRYMGSWYTNSIVTGNWEDFIAYDVVQYMDQNYRTLSRPGSRGIAGSSMGGYGALMMAMKHPDIFSALYALSGADLVFEDSFLDIFKEDAIQASVAKSFDIFNPTRAIIARSVAYAPNLSAEPFMSEFPFNEEGVLVDSSWQKWLVNDPSKLIETYKQNLNELNAIQFDCGNSDPFLIESVHFSQALNELGIDHTFLKFNGGHVDKLDERLRSEVFQFFNQYLAHSQE